MSKGFFRHLWVLAAAACLLATPVMAPAQVAVSEVAHQQFVFAYRLLQRGDTKLAIEAFDEFLGKFPRDEKRGDALYFRALLAKQQGQIAAAQKLLDQPAPPPTLVPISALLLLKGEVAADLKQYQTALESLEKLDLESLDPPLRASALFLRGQAYRGTKNLAAAGAQFSAASLIDSPLRPRAQLELSRIQAQEDKLDLALTSAKLAATSGDPEVAPQAGRAAGDYAYQDGQYLQALEFYKLVITNYSTTDQMSPSILGSMWAMLSMKQYLQIVTLFEQYKASLLPADRVVAWYVTGTAHQELGEHEKAIGMLNALVLGSTGSSVEDKAMYKLAYSQSEMGLYEQAQQTTLKLREKHPTSPLVIDSEFLLASVDAKRGNPQAAIKRISGIIERGSDKTYYPHALLLRAKFLENTKQFDLAAKDYASYLTTAAKPAPGQVLAPETVYDAALRLIDIDYRQNRFDAAAKTAASLLAVDTLPQETRLLGLYRQALAMIRLKQYEPAEKSLTSLIDMPVQSTLKPQAYYYRGLVRMALRKSDDAVSDLMICVKEPGLSDALKINALRLASIQQREANAVAPAVTTILALEKLAGLTGLSAGELLWIGQERLRENNPTDAMKYLRPIIERQVDSATDQRALAMRYSGQSLRMVGNLPAAVTAYRQAISLGQGDQSQSRLDLASTLAQQGNTREAMDEFQGLINSESSAVAAAALDQTATMYISMAEKSAATNDPAGSKQSYEEARRLLKRLVLLYAFPELSPLPEMAYIRLSEIETALGSPAQALSNINELQQKHPGTPYADYAKATQMILSNIKAGDALFIYKKLQEQKLEKELAQRVSQRIKELEAKP